MKNTKVTLAPLEAEDREQFILDNQESFKYGAVEEFGLRDNHFEEDGEIIGQPYCQRGITPPFFAHFCDSFRNNSGFGLLPVI